MSKRSVMAIVGLAASMPAWALSDFNDGSAGVSCHYWDKASGTSWKNTGGDWVDAAGRLQGWDAFKVTYITDTNTVKPVSWDVTALVKKWGASSAYRGIMVRNIGGTNAVVFGSRESANPPKLVITYADGNVATLATEADSQLQCPWYTPIGTRTDMKLDRVQNIVLRFNAQRRTDVVSARLVMTTTAQYGNTSVGMFQLVQPGATATTSTTPASSTTTTSPTTSTSSTAPTTSTSGTTSTSTSTSALATTSSNAKIYALYDGSTGVTCSAWNSAGKFNWRNKGGDWLDANGSAQGSTPLAKALVSGGGKAFSFDVTRTVQSWSAASVYRGFMLRVVPNETSGTVYFGSRESSMAPVLTVTYNDGSSVTVKPHADSHLDCSTVYSKGQSTTLTVSSSLKAALSFDVPRRTDVRSASLKMTTASSSGTASIGVYQLRQPETGDNLPVQQGIAAAYPGDVGIESNPDVLFVERFEQSNFYQSTKWGYSTLPSSWTAETLSSDSNGFQPLSNKAYRVRINAGANYGTALELKTQKALGYQPEELYFRYNLRFGSNFRDTADGGKMPGLSGDTSIAGNGGRETDGTNGWSLRGSFFNTKDPANPIYPRVLLGTYAYHADLGSTYGDHWPWQKNGLGLVEQNRWYSVEQYVKMNTVGQKNGILKVWIDGKLAYEMYNLNLRTVSGWPIYKAWINHYYGGVGTPSHNLGMYIDNLVLAKKYIGPMKR